MGRKVFGPRLYCGAGRRQESQTPPLLCPALGSKRGWPSGLPPSEVLWVCRPLFLGFLGQSHESGRGFGDGTGPESLPSTPRVTARVETQLLLPSRPSHNPRVRSLGFCSVVLSCRPVNTPSAAQSEPPGRGEQLEGSQVKGSLRTGYGLGGLLNFHFPPNLTESID